MLKDLEKSFNDSLFQFITGNINSRTIIKKHSENLKKNGDFSLPNSLKCWREGELETYSKISEKNTLLECVKKDIKDFITQSENWCLQISEINLKLDRLHIYLDRRKAIERSLFNGETNCKLVMERIKKPTKNIICDNNCKESNDLLSLRVKVVADAIENICNTVDNISNNVYVTGKSSNNGPEGCYYILCGSVLNAKTGHKEATISADDYVKIRHTEMTLIAQHKYGLRVSSDCKWRDYLAHLGNSAVTFELLQIKPSTCIKVNFECSSGSSKGAAFVLYNCARLESILRTYNEKVEDGSYPPLPSINEVDFSLLTHEDEWTLLFNYIFGFPSLINGCVVINEKQCEFRPHNICNFLSSMVRVFRTKNPFTTRDVCPTALVENTK